MKILAYMFIVFRLYRIYQCKIENKIYNDVLQTIIEEQNHILSVYNKGRLKFDADNIDRETRLRLIQSIQFNRERKELQEKKIKLEEEAEENI